jgi:hypothetical protein
VAQTYLATIIILMRSGATLATFIDLEVMEMPSSLGIVTALIGWDILDRMHLIYNGPGGTFTLAD